MRYTWLWFDACTDINRGDPSQSVEPMLPVLIIALGPEPLYELSYIR